MTITRALVELKHISDKLMKKMDVRYVGNYQERANKILGTDMTKEEFASHVKEQVQSVQDLIKRRYEIKRKVMASNAKTKVKIADKTYTVAEAIDRRQNLEIEKDFLSTLRNQLTMAVGNSEKSRKDLEEKVENMIEQNLGANRKSSKEDYDNIAKPFFEANEIKVFDPAGVRSLVEKMQEEVEAFDKEVDFALSESNAKTEI